MVILYCFVIIPIISFSCFHFDGNMMDQTFYYYVNNSEYSIKITTPTPSNDPYMADAIIIDSTIGPGDTIRFHNKIPAGLYCPFGCYDSNLAIKLEFASTPPQCLIFSGSINNDEATTDIRTIYSYARKDLDNGAVKLFYTIDNAHFEQAKPCE